MSADIIVIKAGQFIGQREISLDQVAFRLRAAGANTMWVLDRRRSRYWPVGRGTLETIRHYAAMPGCFFDYLNHPDLCD
jgi:hypothetical protein